MKKLRITIGDKSYDVTVEVLSDDTPHHSSVSVPRPAVALGSPASAPAVTPPAPQRPAGAGAVCCPMSGTVKSILCKIGDAVQPGEPLLVLDAMKMENRIMAPAAGKVISIDVKEGDSVLEGQQLLTVQ